MWAAKRLPSCTTSTSTRMPSTWGQGNLAEQFKQLSRVATALGGNDADGGPPPRGWLCRQKDCVFALRGIRNYPERTHCWGCYKPKAVTLKATDKDNKNKDKNEVTNGNNETTTKEAKRREARVRRRQAAVDYQKANSPPSPPAPVPPTPDGPGPVATAMSQVAAPPGVKRLGITAEIEEKTPLLTTDVLKIDSLHYEIIPPDLEARTPEATLTKFIGEKSPTAKAARRAEMEADSAKFKAAIASLNIVGGGGESMAGAIADLQAKLDANEAALVKVIKDQPTQGHERKAVVEAKSKFEVAMQARKDREDQGLAKAQERRQERHQHIAKLKAQLDILDAELAKMEDASDAKYKARAVKAQEQDMDVIKLFDKKLESLQAAVDMDTTSGPGAAAIALPPIPAQPSQVATQEFADIAAMKKHIEVLEAKLKEAAEKVTKEFEIRFEDIQAAALPTLDVPDKKEIPAYMSLLQVLNNWHCSGAALPFDWEALAKVTTDGPKPVDMCRKLLGSTWGKWYGQAGPLESAIVPRQVALLAHYNLNANKDKFEDKEAQKEATKRAEQGMESIRDSAKKIRTG